jgi:hypothetical protein
MHSLVARNRSNKHVPAGYRLFGLRRAGPPRGCCDAFLTSHLFCCCCCCRSVLRQLVGDFEYFLGILPDGSGLAAPLNPGFKAPIQLGRQVLAQLAGAPERCVSRRA